MTMQIDVTLRDEALRGEFVFKLTYAEHCYNIEIMKLRKLTTYEQMVITTNELSRLQEIFLVFGIPSTFLTSVLLLTNNIHRNGMMIWCY